MARIRLFASAREAAGIGADEIGGATVGEVLDAAIARYGNDFGELLTTCRVWCNGEPADRGDRVGDTDEVAVLPPVSGGAGRPGSAPTRGAGRISGSSTGPDPDSTVRAMIPDLRRVLDPSYLEGLTQVSRDELRVMRAECSDLENGLSYVRRLAQGRLDLIVAETSRRGSGNGGDLTDLIESLPELLSDGGRPEASGRVSEDLDPPDHVVAPLVERLDAAVAPTALSGITELGRDELASAVRELTLFEDDVSTGRRTLHTTIDTLNDELARRIAAGEAPPAAR